MGNQARTLLVTGASGQLGNRVVELLLQRGGDRVVAASRNPDKLAALAAQGAEVRAADFDAPETLDQAFAGVERLLIISTDALDRPGRRLEQHLRAVAAARRAGVKHIVYTSLTNPGPDSLIKAIAPDHRETEAAIAATGIPHTILRNNMYIDLSLGSLPHAVAHGELRSAVGGGKIGYVTREDCARAAAAALAGDWATSRTLDITGPSSLSAEDLARAASDASGKPVRFVSVTLAEYTQGLVGAGLPLPVAEVFASFDAAASAGQLDVASRAVEDLTGKPAESVLDFLRRHRSALGA